MITSENLPQILSAISWPITLSGLVCYFRSEIADLLNRLRKGKLGSFEGDFDPMASETRVVPRQAGDSPESRTLSGKIVRDKPANIYWLGKDLMQTVDLLLRRAPRDRIVWQIKQANHHMKESGLEGSNVQVRLKRMVDDADVSLERDWTDPKRLSVAQEVSSIINEFGQIVNASQPDFKPDPPA